MPIGIMIRPVILRATNCTEKIQLNRLSQFCLICTERLCFSQFWEQFCYNWFCHTDMNSSSKILLCLDFSKRQFNRNWHFRIQANRDLEILIFIDTSILIYIGFDHYIITFWIFSSMKLLLYFTRFLLILLIFTNYMHVCSYGQAQKHYLEKESKAPKVRVAR